MSAEPPATSPASARTQPPSTLLRLARSLRPGRNPLARGVYRAEGTIVLLFALLALVARSAQQAGARHETVAVLTEDAPVTADGTVPEMAGVTSKVEACWRLPDGTARTGRVAVAVGLETGAEVPVWLDSSGTPTGPPVSRTDAAVAGALVAMGGWFTAAGLLTLLGWGLHRAFDRRRYRAWDFEWAAEGAGPHKQH